MARSTFPPSSPIITVPSLSTVRAYGTLNVAARLNPSADPSAEDAEALPAIVVTSPPFDIERMVLPSVIKIAPPQYATVRGSEKVAAVPTPFDAPEAPDPATVVTVPTELPDTGALRMRTPNVSGHHSMSKGSMARPLGLFMLA